MIELWNDARIAVDEYGLRNAQLTLLAPTGTIGFIMDCDTTGIEPDFGLVKGKEMAGGGYEKIVNQSVGLALRNLSYSEDKIESIVKHLKATGNIETATHLKPEHLAIFDTAVAPKGGKRFISPMGHIKMMAAVQPFLSGAISKTVNMPQSSTHADVAEIYMEAWKRGVKAVALYRDGSKGAQVLSTTGSEDSKTKSIDEKPSDVETKSSDSDVKPQEVPKRKKTQKELLTFGKRRELPAICKSMRIKAKVFDQTVYLHTGEYPDGTLGEVFIDAYKQGSPFKGLLDLVSILMSKGLQYGVPLEEIVETLKLVHFEPAGMVKHPYITKCTSIPDYVGRELGRIYLNDYRLVQVKHKVKDEDSSVEVDSSKESSSQDESTSTEESSDAIQPSKKVETLTSPKMTEVPQPKLMSQPSYAGPLCKYCGHETRMSGTCHKCYNCGETDGC